jgi:diguanylate cyclase (GGDEF)-like protein
MLKLMIYGLMAFSVILSLKTSQEVFLGILIIPVVLSVYFQAKKTAFFILIGSSLLTLFSLFFVFKPTFSLSLIASYVILYLAASKNRDKFEAMKAKYSREIKNKKGKQEDLIKENEKMKHYSEDMDQQTGELEDLYEVTKHMSAYLKLDEIVRILSRELKSDFNFDDCRLINIQPAKDEIEIDDIYDMTTERKLPSPKVHDKSILSEISKKRKPFSVTQETDKKVRDSLKLPDNTITLLAIPIIVDEEIDSIIIVENLRVPDFEKFSIVIGQFALEMRKIKLYQIVEKLSMIDGLTNLLLRRNFTEALEKELERIKSYNLKLASLMIDVDHFKKLNDKYGHLAGDRVLVKIAQVIKDNTRRIDLASRYGGEEFAVALPETDREGAIIVAERIREQVEKEEFEIDSQKVKTTVSIGLSFFPDNTEDLTELIDLSDKALYKAKETGRNKVCVYKG